MNQSVTYTTDDLQMPAAAGPGRPTLYTAELGNQICELLAEGKTLTSICKEDDNLPSDRTVRRWALDGAHPFAPQYARAREIGYHVMADMTLDVSDGKGIEPGQVARDRLKVDTRKWLLSKALPKIYGDKVALSGDADGEPIKVLARIERVIVQSSG